MATSRFRLAGIRALIAVAALAAAACSPLGVVATGSPAGDARLTVTSTLDGLTSLAHRIHWQAFPRPLARVAEVDFLIDGKVFWTEHNSPYFYGDDGSFLVTSFLAPGPHAFTVRALDADRHASCRSSPCPRAGFWRLVISPIGLQVYDSAGGGSLYDVVYPSPGLAEIRTGMATGHPGTDGGAWCPNGRASLTAGLPVRVRWAIHGNQLSFTPLDSQTGSCGIAEFLEFRYGVRAVSWTREGS